MKGLLLKDLYNMSSQFKIYLALPIIAAIISYQQGSLEFLQFMTAMIIMFVPLSAFSYDEMCDFNTYAMTLPIDRKDLALSRYVLSAMIAIAIGLISITLAFLLAQFFGSQFTSFDARTYAVEEISICLALNAVNCLLLPLLFKFGSEKARIALVLIFASFSAIAFMFSEQLSQLSLGHLDGTLVMSCVVAAFLIFEALSLWISYRIVEKKEF